MPLIPPGRYQHILWDWNGTLLDDAALCVEIMDQLLRRYGKPGLTPERYQRIFDFPVRDYYQALGFDFSRTPFEQVGTEFMMEYYRRWRTCQIRQHAQTVLRRFQQQRIPQSILSAASVSLVQQGLEHFGLDSFFADIHGLDHHYAEGKLAQAQAFLSHCTSAPETVLLIGDTTHDHQVASAVGMDCVLIPAGHHALERLQACGVPLCTTLQDLIA